MRRDEGGELGLGNRTHLGTGGRAVLEQDQGRNAANAKLRRSAGVLVHIQLHHLQLARVFGGQLFEDAPTANNP